MRRGAAAITLAVCAAACGVHVAPGVPKEELKDLAMLTTPGADVTMSGINLYLHDTRPTGDAPQKPTFWVRAETFALLEENTWSFEKAYAVAYGRDEGAQDIHFEAASGEFKEQERAVLRGGVKAHIGTMTLELEDVEWRNADRMAHTERPVHMLDGTTDLMASALRMYPDEERLFLTDVSGFIDLERNAS